MAIGWDETAPADTDLASTGDDALRSLKTALATGIGQSMYWPGSGGGSAASAGQMKPGAARTFYGTLSQVSANSDGCLMVTSDTSQLFYVGSASTPFLGSLRAIEAATLPIARGSRWVRASGTAGNGTDIQFGLTYSESPYIQVSIVSSVGTYGSAVITSLTSSAMSVEVYRQNAVAYAASTWTVQWSSVGTVVF